LFGRFVLSRTDITQPDLSQVPINAAFIEQVPLRPHTTNRIATFACVEEHREAGRQAAVAHRYPSETLRTKSRCDTPNSVVRIFLPTLWLRAGTA
jgi:hypothetical protein